MYLNIREVSAFSFTGGGHWSGHHGYRAVHPREPSPDRGGEQSFLGGRHHQHGALCLPVTSRLVARAAVHLVGRLPPHLPPAVLVRFGEVTLYLSVQLSGDSELNLLP